MDWVVTVIARFSRAGVKLGDLEDYLSKVLIKRNHWHFKENRIDCTRNQ